MAESIPFSEETFRPVCIKGNEAAAEPVEFVLNSVGGVNRARLKSMLIATQGLSDTGTWSPEIQDAVVRAFETGPGVFVEGIKTIRGLTAPIALARHVGILQAEALKSIDPQSQYPITTGYEFSRVCGHWPVLTFEIAMAIARLSGQSEIDPRFFAWLSTSLGISANQLGTAEPVRRARANKGTAGSGTRKGKRDRATS